ncbi:MAG: sigma-54-dependent Fis family transcriptional regulator [Candidatus Sumerlaeia bacterium]|nr:sigma-54-dependent Fis family transcriptional regulator [Candidatus Sumerlaeia bacterium]
MMDDALVLPATSTLAVLSPEGSSGEFVVHLAPRWLTASLGLDHLFPVSAKTSGSLIPLLDMAQILWTGQQVVRDYCLEFSTEENGAIIALVDGFRVEELRKLDGVPGDGPGIIFSLRDVTSLVRERRKTAAIGAFHGIVGRSLPMLEVFQRIAIYGATDAPVVITGETGVGKELVARALHERSPRKGKPFVAVNCGALTSDLFESELFGHEKGSFTGAVRQHQGRFLRANEGTLFLDEIGEMPAMSQAKLLRALEEGVIERVGAEREERVDVRLIAATNVALEQAVQWRKFRADLYHRISVLRIHVPPLRDRKGDIPLLVEDFLARFNTRYQKEIRRFTPEAMKVLEEYHWPGNVRELRNVVERLVIESVGSAIGANALSQWRDEREYFTPGEWNADGWWQPRTPIVAPAPPFPPTASAPGWPFDQDVMDAPREGARYWGQPQPRQLAPPRWDGEIVEAPIFGKHSDADGNSSQAREITPDTIRTAFIESGGNITAAARSLGVHKATLYRHMKQFNMTRESLEEELP